MFLVDSHCHLNLLNYINIHKNVADVLKKANDRGIKLVLSVSTSILDYEDTIKYVKNCSNVLLSCGIHPIYLDKIHDVDYNKLHKISLQEEIIAIGETGLDYHYKSGFIVAKKQKEIFQKHINIAKETNKPIIVHSRNASKDTIEVLRSEGANQCGGILHCFNEDIDFARSLLNLNFYISFSGIVTFRNSELFKKVIRYIPEDRILLETDSPYLAPIPYRGQENQPAYIYEIAKYIAQIKKITIDRVASVTTNNFCTLFHLIKKQYYCL